jgi:hypothetical protein
MCPGFHTDFFKVFHILEQKPTHMETQKIEESLEAINENLVNIAHMLNAVFTSVLSQEQRDRYIRKGIESGWIDSSTDDIATH